MQQTRREKEVFSSLFILKDNGHNYREISLVRQWGIQNNTTVI